MLKLFLFIYRTHLYFMLPFRVINFCKEISVLKLLGTALHIHIWFCFTTQNVWPQSMHSKLFLSEQSQIHSGLKQWFLKWWLETHNLGKHWLLPIQGQGEGEGSNTIPRKMLQPWEVAFFMRIPGSIGSGGGEPPAELPKSLNSFKILSWFTSSFTIRNLKWVVVAF